MLSKRAKSLKPSPTLALNAKAQELKAQGHDVISLSVGEPDWSTYQVITDTAIESLKRGDTKYYPSNGILPLRQAIVKQTQEDFDIAYDPKCVTVSAGAKFILFSALQVLVDPGDEVIIPAPYWVSYPTMVELAGGISVIPECGANTRFKLTGEFLEKHITPSTKLLILNSPSNPTGESYTVDELKSIAKVLEKHPQVLVLSDDIYNHLIFDGNKVAPHLLQVAPQLKDRVVVINGCSKTYAMTGWRLGWALGPKEIIDAMTNYQSQSVSCATSFVQVAAVAALEKTGPDLAKAALGLKKRRDLFLEHLRQVPGIEVATPPGAFYLWPSIQNLLGKHFKAKPLATSKDWAEALLEDQKVAVVPGVEFGLEGFVRMSFTLSEDRIVEACNRINNFVKQTL